MKTGKWAVANINKIDLESPRMEFSKNIRHNRLSLASQVSTDVKTAGGFISKLLELRGYQNKSQMGNRK